VSDHDFLEPGNDDEETHEHDKQGPVEPVQNLSRQLAIDGIPIGNVKTKPRVSSQIVAPCRRRRADDFLEETRMVSTDPSAAPLPPSGHQTQLHRAVIASTVGTALEWYDLFLYSTVTGLVFAKLFFPQSDPWVGTLEAFAIYAVGFVARPVGAAIFGAFDHGLGLRDALDQCKARTNAPGGKEADVTHGFLTPCEADLRYWRA
jgi:hypothetical protein